MQQGCDAKLGSRTGSAISVSRVEFIVQELPPKYLFLSSALNIYRFEVTSEVLVVFFLSSPAVPRVFSSDERAHLLRSRSKGEAQPPGPGCEIQAAGHERQPDAAAQLQVGLRWTHGGGVMNKYTNCFGQLVQMESACMRRDTGSAFLFQGNTQEYSGILVPRC